MQVKKAGGKVYGAVLTAAEKKAMDLEIQRELAEYDRKHIAEIDADSLQHLSAEPNIILVLHLIPTDQFLDSVMEGVVISSEPLSPEPELLMQHP